LSYLVDTNVLSELVKAKPNLRVENWARTIPNEARHISVLAIGEIRRGIARLPDSLRKERLRLWLETELPKQFARRILPVDEAVAHRWGQITAVHPRTLPAIDGLLAATALHHELTLVTRNTKDFDVPGLLLFNPWEID
jgi:toxin FitB